jgi:hypothetical protein
VTEPLVSPAGSSVGYSLWTALARNKGPAKIAASALAAYFVSVAELITNPSLKVAAVGVVGLAVKLGLDYLDFRLTDVNLGARG